MRLILFKFFLATALVTPNVAAEDLRSLPTKTKLTSAVSYSVLANSICLVMTPTDYKHGFDADECIGLFHHESLDTCILSYEASGNERALNGLLIIYLIDVQQFMRPSYDPRDRNRKHYDSSGIVAFATTNLTYTLGFQMACRSAGGKKPMDMAGLRKVLAPYFDLEMPSPAAF